MITNFLYNDIILYARGWYQRNDIVDDLGYLISKIYCNYPKTDKEVAHYMLMVLDELNEQLGNTFISSAHGRSYAWLFGSASNFASVMNVSFDMGIIHAVLEFLMTIDCKKVIKLNPPHYGKKEHFRMGFSPISMTYKEMNRRAKKMFGND